MKHAHYDAVTFALLGWYDPKIHKIIPSPNLQISDEEWQHAIDQNFNCIDTGTNSLFTKDFRSQIEIDQAAIDEHNAPIYAALDKLDLKSIRAIRENDAARITALEAEATLLRVDLLPNA